VEVDRKLLCRTKYVANEISPTWEHCCEIADGDAGGYAWFSVFDSDTLKSEGDYLGSAGLNMSEVSGEVVLTLEGSDLPGARLEKG